MQDILFLSVDLGTSFIKAAVYDTQGNCLATASQPVKDERPAPGVFLQRGEDLLSSAVACIRQAAGAMGARAGDIAAISFTGQMSGFMGVDKNFDDVTTWSCSLDGRYMPYAERQMATLKDKFLTISGTTFPQMAPKYEWYKTEFPEENKRVAKYLMLSGYLIGKLGDMDIDDAVMDTTYTAWTGLVDVKNGRWSDEICDAVGLDPKYLPRIVSSDTICGKLSAAAAQETGLKSGIPLVSGAGDKNAGCLGAAIVEPGDMIFEASSYGMVEYCAKDFRPDEQAGRYDILTSPVPGLFIPGKFVVGSGITLDWYINHFVRKEGEKLGDAFARMDEQVAKIPPGCDGVMAIGLLGGSSMPLDGALRGLFMGHDWSHGPAHFYRALLESFTYDFALTIDRMDEMYPEHKAKCVKVVGGGARSAVWTQMNADLSGRVYQALDRDDVAMWGAAILAGSATGVFTDMKQTAKDHVHVKKEFIPSPDMREKYLPYKSFYAQATKDMRASFVRLHKLHQNL